jgi:hypothetical protein
LIYYWMRRINITHNSIFSDISLCSDVMPTSAPTFRRTLLILSSGSKSKPTKQQDVHSQQSSLSLKMGTVRFSETSVNFYWVTGLHTSEDITILCQFPPLKFILFLFFSSFREGGPAMVSTVNSIAS